MTYSFCCLFPSFPFQQEVDEEPENLNYDEAFQDKVESWDAAWLQEFCQKKRLELEKKKHFEADENQDYTTSSPDGERHVTVRTRRKGHM